MKIEKTFYRISFKETFLLLGLLLILFNGLIFTYTLITGNPRILIYDSSWILQFLFPILYSIIMTSIHRNGVLKITSFNNATALIDKIELLVSKRYIRLDSETGNIKYMKKTKWARFFNYFFRESIKMKITEEEIVILAKKNLLDLIEMRIKYDRTK